MYLQNKRLYYLSFLTFYLRLTVSIHNKDLVVSESGLEVVSPCSIGLRFFSELNNTSEEDLFVELISDECCIHFDDSEDFDCDSVEIIGESSQVVEKGQVKKFTLVAPILDPFERKGFCRVHVDSRPIDKRNVIMRDNIKINFNTTLKNNMADTDLNETIKKCKNKDEDPFNDCKPVDCDTYYNGKKPIYDENTKRCIEVPKPKNVKSDLNTLYDPISNRCIEGDPIDSEDIDFIKSVNKERHPKDIIIVESTDFPILYNSEIENLKSNSTNTTNAKTLEFKNKQVFCGSFMKYLATNRYTFLVLVMVIFVQCCLICTMIYFLTKRSICCDKKKVERKYFNYRQDVSVTTPLIGTSNIDTETTGFDYVTESSKIDNKIKCYKACQKERKNDPKLSMSDDILLKCLNRRDWNCKPKSDTTRDINNAYNSTANPDWNAIKANIETTIPEQYTKDNISEEIQKETTEDKDFRTRPYKEDYSDNDSSEKLIQSHDYNAIQHRNNIVNTEISTNRKAISVSTEKGAQASFSNDSIDDFLSERGMMFLAGDAASKYSFTSTPSTSADRSSKTSKNNVVKNVLSYFSRKSRKQTSSDPGVEKPKEKDLELIHMSRGSMYSSSASEYKNVKGVKIKKDSRTSF